MQPPDLHPHPADRDTTLLVVLIALLALPAFFLFWVWLAQAKFDPAAALAGTFRRVDDDPLLLAAVVDLCLLLLTGAVWLQADARRRGIGRAGRTAWVVALLVLGSLGLWMYLAARPPTRRPGQ